MMKKSPLVVLVFAVLLSCGDGEQAVKKVVRPILHQEVGYLGGAKVRTFSGTARTDKIVNLSFRSGGIITRFDVQLGQRVKKGDLLGRLDNVQANLNYESALSSLNSAASQMNTAKLSLNRIRSLYEKGSASLSDFEAAKNSFRTAEQSYESTRRSVAIQKEQVNFGFLYAPEDGTIAAVNAEVDENVNPGQVVAILNAGTDMEISIGLPESVINFVRPGMNVEVDFPALGQSTFDAKISEISPSVDAGTSTYPVRVIVVNPSSAIRSGMAANVTFNLGSEKEAQKTLIVPAHAVGEDSNGRFVFLVNTEGETTVVKKHRVTIGPLTSDGFEIRSGLQAGERIAVAGLQTLLDGQQVRLQ